MSSLDERIQEYCPNGVEYKTLGEIAVDVFRGTGIKRNKVTEKGIVSHTVLENVPSQKIHKQPMPVST